MIYVPTTFDSKPPQIFEATEKGSDGIFMWVHKHSKLQLHNKVRLSSYY